MTMAAPLAVLLVGAGSMGSLHARVTSQNEGTRLVTVVDPRAEIGAALAERLGASWRPELGSLDGIDAVIVAAATEAHGPLARQVLEAGVPLLVEKPVTPTLDETRAVLDLSRERGVPMMCGLLERYNPAVVTARSIVQAPVHVTATRHSPYAPRIRTGVAWDLLVHDVDLAMQFLPGDVDQVEAVVGQFHPSSLPGAEDVVQASLKFSQGGVASVSASRVGQKKVRELVIHELDRMVEIDLLRRGVTVYHHVAAEASDEGRGYRQQTVIEIPEMTTSREPLAAQLDRFVALVRGEVDADAERDSILPSHSVVARVKEAAAAVPA
ncbi:Gfo/Idh/MocA family protein [Cellulomonas sp. S1-8]|uniref:Gfo/Idh/MocA family protein n=1 Tax=Cellulomonas sp. S1-8 TaxID=2904790 RepID=UPI0022430BF1|nr:Gfo/Idh/MocA family oxidoreductase [Cellulomonas sp. S1-8]UZN01928.1 Gfo/Idh/MocA family oxidoreductase [Cellulomonas sp. S1-8]